MIEELYNFLFNLFDGGFESHIVSVLICTFAFGFLFYLIVKVLRFFLVDIFGGQ